MIKKLWVLSALICSGLQAMDGSDRVSLGLLEFDSEMPDLLLQSPVSESWLDNLEAGSSEVTQKEEVSAASEDTAVTRKRAVSSVTQSAAQRRRLAGSEDVDQKSSRFTRHYENGAYLIVHDGRTFDTREFVRGSSIVKCLDSQCTEEFKRLNDLVAHLKNAHNAEKFIRCNSEGCGKTFNKSNSHFEHFRREHCPKLANWKKCLFVGCDFESIQNSNLISHIGSEKHFAVSQVVGKYSKCPMPDCTVQFGPWKVDSSPRDFRRQQAEAHLRAVHMDEIKSKSKKVPSPVGKA